MFSVPKTVYFVISVVMSLSGFYIVIMLDSSLEERGKTFLHNLLVKVVWALPLFCGKLKNNGFEFLNLYGIIQIFYFFLGLSLYIVFQEICPLH